MVAGEVYANPWGSYLIYFDTTEDGQGADIDVNKQSKNGMSIGF